jgi:YVTN family beta-propeller protein
VTRRRGYAVGSLVVRSALACATLLVGAGCGGDDGPKVNDVPFAGEAFPPAKPSFSLPNGPYALVTNSGSDDLSVLDVTTGTELARVPVGLNPLDHDGPHHLAVDAAHGYVFVALSYPLPTLAPGPHAAHASGSAKGKLVRLDLPSLTRSAVAPTDTNPGDVVVSDDGARLVVSHYDLRRAVTLASQGIDAQRADLLVWDTSKLAANTPPSAATAIPVCIAPHGVILDKPRGDHAYVACYGEDALAVVDFTASPPTVARIPVGPSPGAPAQPSYGPYALTLSADGQAIFVGDTEGRDLRRFDVSTQSMADEAFAAGGAVYFSAVRADGVAFVPVQTPDQLLRVNTATMQAEATRTFDATECRAPHEAWVRPNGDVLLVCEGDHVATSHVLVVDGETLATKAVWPVGVYPDKIVVVGE